MGDCYDVRAVDKAPPIYLKLDCALPHQNEVFATFDYTARRTTRAGRARGPGQARVPEVVGRPSWASPTRPPRYELAYDLPTRPTWGNGIRHVVGCLSSTRKGDALTGSAQGSAQ